MAVADGGTDDESLTIRGGAVAVQGGTLKRECHSAWLLLIAGCTLFELLLSAKCFPVRFVSPGEVLVAVLEVVCRDDVHTDGRPDAFVSDTFVARLSGLAAVDIVDAVIWVMVGVGTETVSGCKMGELNAFDVDRARDDGGAGGVVADLWGCIEIRRDGGGMVEAVGRAKAFVLPVDDERENAPDCVLNILTGECTRLLNVDVDDVDDAASGNIPRCTVVGRGGGTKTFSMAGSGIYDLEPVLLRFGLGGKGMADRVTGAATPTMPRGSQIEDLGIK